MNWQEQYRALFVRPPNQSPGLRRLGSSGSDAGNSTNREAYVRWRYSDWTGIGLSQPVIGDVLERDQMEADRAYTIDEARAIANVGKTSLYKAIYSGGLIARKNGRKTIILGHELLSWLHNLPAIAPRNTSIGASASAASTAQSPQSAASV